MRAIYINLDAATERRAGMEAAFDAVPHDGWELARFTAVTAAAMAEAPGSLQATEKACFESHRRLLGQSLDDEQAIYVLEDDVAFSDKAFPFLSALAAWDGEWDVLFTEVSMVRATDVLRVAFHRERLAQTSDVVAFPLEGALFVGAMAYLVRGGFKAKLHSMLMEAEQFDLPYDLWLRRLVEEGRMKALVALPYLTTPAPAASSSQIDAPRHPLHVRAHDTFRRLMFVDRDMAACRREAAEIHDQTPELEQILGALIGGIATRQA